MLFSYLGEGKFDLFLEEGVLPISNDGKLSIDQEAWCAVDTSFLSFYVEIFQGWDELPAGHTGLIICKVKTNCTCHGFQLVALIAI